MLGSFLHNSVCFSTWWPLDSFLSSKIHFKCIHFFPSPFSPSKSKALQFFLLENCTTFLTGLPPSTAATPPIVLIDRQKVTFPHRTGLYSASSLPLYFEENLKCLPQSTAYPSDFILYHCLPHLLITFLFLEHIKIEPMPRPLYPLFPLHGMLFPQFFIGLNPSHLSGLNSSVISS